MPHAGSEQHCRELKRPGASQKTPSPTTSPGGRSAAVRHPLRNVRSGLRGPWVSFLRPASEHPPSEHPPPTAAGLSFPGCQAGRIWPGLQDIAQLSASPLHGDNCPFKSLGHSGCREGADGPGSTGGCQLECFVEPRHCPSHQYTNTRRKHI